jgi:hypothetical protein
MINGETAHHQLQALQRRAYDAESAAEVAALSRAQAFLSVGSAGGAPGQWTGQPPPPQQLASLAVGVDSRSTLMAQEVHFRDGEAGTFDAFPVASGLRGVILQTDEAPEMVSQLLLHQHDDRYQHQHASPVLAAGLAGRHSMHAHHVDQVNNGVGNHSQQANQQMGSQQMIPFRQGAGAQNSAPWASAGDGRGVRLDGAIFGSPQHGAAQPPQTQPQPFEQYRAAPPQYDSQPRQYKQMYTAKQGFMHVASDGPNAGALVPTTHGSAQTVPIRYLQATVVPTYSCVLGMALGDLAIYPTYLQFTAKLCEPEAPVPLESIDAVQLHKGYFADEVQLALDAGSEPSSTMDLTFPFPFTAAFFVDDLRPIWRAQRDPVVESRRTAQYATRVQSERYIPGGMQVSAAQHHASCIMHHACVRCSMQHAACNMAGPWLGTPQEGGVSTRLLPQAVE